MDTEDSEEEYKIDVGETSVPWACVKQEELEEEQLCDILDSKAINYKQILRKQILDKNVYESMHMDKKEMENDKYNLINLHSEKIFAANKMIFNSNDIKEEYEEVQIKFDNTTITDINSDNIDCKICSKECNKYCTKCSPLIYILNNNVSHVDNEWKVKTIPVDILEIRSMTIGDSVFALKTLPENVIFGPFEGLSATESSNGYMWKLKDGQLMDIESGNWMQYVGRTINALFKNLDVFQFEGNLYFQTNREIKEGEELLVHYSQEEIQMSDNNEEIYYIPVLEKKSQQIFACTRCCFGFNLEKHLIVHKTKCPYSLHNVDTIEIIQCPCCQIWLEAQEYLKHHVESYSRIRHYPVGITRSRPNASIYIETITHDEFSDIKPDINSTNDFETEKPFTEIDTCNTNYTYKLQEHLSTHTDVKKFECDLNMKIFSTKSTLTSHMKRKHSKRIEKAYKCSQCSYRTNFICRFRRHLNTHSGVKPRKTILSEHIKNTHIDNDNIKQNLEENGQNYNCTECSYKTNVKSYFKRHSKRHANERPFKCEICMRTYTEKGTLTKHIKYKHAEGNEKLYKCSWCPYQTNIKFNFMKHHDAHNDIEAYKCEICMKNFAHNVSLKSHVEKVHTNSNKYKCIHCSYKTNIKSRLTRHSKIHTNDKPFRCDICMAFFTEKGTLKKHIQYKHSKNTEKTYKCSQCSYQTDIKGNFQSHLNTHTDIKQFQCDLCERRFSAKFAVKRHRKMVHLSEIEKLRMQTKNDQKPFKCDLCIKRFTVKGSLTKHIQYEHFEGIAKAYKCTACSYETNIKCNFQRHINTHSNATE